MPTGESMISSLKSNNSIKLDKSSRFRKTLGGYGKNRKPEYDFPEANQKLLEQIKLKTKKDYKKSQMVYGIFFIILFVLAIYIFFYLNSL